MMSRKYSVCRILVAVLATSAFAGCGDSGTDPLPDTVGDLAGTWNATRFLLEPVNAPQVESFDIVAAGGALRMDVRSNGEVVLTTTNPGSTTPDVDTGTIIRLSATRLELRLDGESPVQLEYVLGTSELTITGRTLVDVEGYAGPADLSARFVRG